MKTFLAAILLLASLFATSQAEPVAFGRFSMDCALPPSQVKRLGVEALHAHWPANQAYEKSTAEIIVVEYDAETMKIMSEGDGDPFVSALGTYLAIYGEPEKTENTPFMGSPEKLRVFKSGVPRDHALYVYTKKLTDGSYVVVGVRVFQESEKTRALLQSVANSFKLGSTEPQD